MFSCLLQGPVDGEGRGRARASIRVSARADAERAREGDRLASRQVRYRLERPRLGEGPSARGHDRLGGLPADRVRGRHRVGLVVNVPAR